MSSNEKDSNGKSRTEQEAKKTKVKKEKNGWGKVLIIYVFLIIIIMFLSGAVIINYSKDGPFYVMAEILFEKSSEGLILGFIIFVISNAITKMQEIK